MLSRAESNEIAIHHLRKLSIQCQTELSLIQDATKSDSDFFVYFYQSDEFLKTGNPISMLAGNAPFIVTRKSGEIITTGTSEDINYYINLYHEGRLV